MLLGFRANQEASQRALHLQVKKFRAHIPGREESPLFRLMLPGLKVIAWGSRETHRRAQRAEGFVTVLRLAKATLLCSTWRVLLQALSPAGLACVFSWLGYLGSRVT